MLPTELIGTPAWGQGWRNVWLGTTVENQAEAERRIPHLLRVPARLHFLSCEPLFGEINLRWLHIGEGIHLDALTGWFGRKLFIGDAHDALPELPFPGKKIGWVIAGGESGKFARPMLPDWPRALRKQCHSTGIPFFFKQWGEWRPVAPIHHPDDTYVDAIGSVDEKRSAIFCANGAEHEDWEGQPPAGAWMMERVGKKHAGAFLDRARHVDFPAISA